MSVSADPAPDPELEIEFEGVSEGQLTEVQFADELDKQPFPVVDDHPVESLDSASLPPLAHPRAVPPDLPKPDIARRPLILSDPAGQLPESNDFRTRVLRIVHGAAMAGLLSSMLIHAVVLSVLAVLVFGGTSLHKPLEILGVLGEPNDGDVAEIELDSVIPPSDGGKDAAPLEFPDMAALSSTDQTKFDPGQSLHGVVGGTGTGNGEGGEREAIAVPAVGIPKYAVTKGSFSAWTEPRDPVPGISYEIVIQFRLPSNVKVYRGSDLSGMVIGTDGYKQAIKFARIQTFPVQDGQVKLRIRVPGAHQLVRDTIRIESKLLREKQIIEIVF